MSGRDNKNKKTVNYKTGFKLIYSELSGKKGRTFGLALIVATLSMVMFSGLIIIFSLNNGINSLSERMGADLMIVPLGYESGAEGVLIKGEPSYFYFNKSVLEDIKNLNLEGIDKITSQFYLTSSSQGCCDIPVQFIGIDENSDFTVLPWIKKSFNSSPKDWTAKFKLSDIKDYSKNFLEDGAVVVGSDIDVPKNRKIRFFDEFFTVSAQLEETGTGLDQAVFTGFSTSLILYDAAQKKGFNFTGDMKPEDSISTILIKVKSGYTPEQIKHDIRSKIDGLQVIETKSLSNSIRGSLVGFITLLYILIVMLLVLTFIILGITFRLSAKERARQFTLMRTVGATKSQVKRLLLLESFIISLTGTIIGIALASVFIFPFSSAISMQISIPFLLPNTDEVILYVLLILIIGSISGPLSAVGSIKSLDKISLYEAGRL